jgi:hypothetical protein
MPRPEFASLARSSSEFCSKVIGPRSADLDQCAFHGFGQRFTHSCYVMDRRYQKCDEFLVSVNGPSMRRACRPGIETLPLVFARPSWPA